MERSTTEPMNGTYQPPDPVATLIDECWIQASGMDHCRTERDMRIAFRAVVEERLRNIPGVASLIQDDMAFYSQTTGGRQ